MVSWCVSVWVGKITTPVFVSLDASTHFPQRNCRKDEYTLPLKSDTVSAWRTSFWFFCHRTCVCLRWFFTFYHSKSPFFTTFWGICFIFSRHLTCKSKSNIYQNLPQKFPSICCHGYPWILFHLVVFPFFWVGRVRGWTPLIYIPKLKGFQKQVGARV